MKSDIVAEFGILIRALRVERGITQEELSYRAGVHRTYIGMIERGEKNVTLESIKKIAKALGISMTNIFSKLEEPQK